MQCYYIRKRFFSFQMRKKILRPTAQSNQKQVLSKSNFHSNKIFFFLQMFRLTKMI